MACKTQKSSADAELPDDVIFSHILPRIPAKTLVTFKSVCRKWHTTLSSREFSRNYLRHPFYLSSRSILTINYTPLFEAVDYGVVDGDPSNTDVALTQFEISVTHPFVWLSASCNGLGFLINSPVDDEAEFPLPDHLRHHDFQYVVFNPALGLDFFVDIPHPPEFAFPSDSYNFGFGYASSLDDYFIVALHFAASDILVYSHSLKSQKWRPPQNFKQQSGLSIEFQDCWFSEVGTLVGETLHWGVTLGLDQRSIAAFNLAAQDHFDFLQLPYPNFGSGSHSAPDFDLACLDGCLCACARYDDGGYVYVAEMWMLKDYRVPHKWTKLFRLNMEDYPSNFFGFTASSKLGMILASDNDELLLTDFTCDPPQYKHTGIEDKVQAVNFVQSLESPFLSNKDNNMSR